MTEFWFLDGSGTPSPRRLAGQQTVVLHAVEGASGWATSSRAAIPDDHLDGEIAGVLLGMIDHLVDTIERDGARVAPAIRRMSIARETSAATAMRRSPPRIRTVQIDHTHHLATTWTSIGWTAAVMLVEELWVGVLCHALEPRLMRQETPDA